MIPLECMLSFVIRAASALLAVRRAFASASLNRIVGGNPLPVAAAGHIADPAFVFKVPPNRFANAGLKGLFGPPAEFTLNLARVHGIAAIVTWPIFYKRYQLTPRRAEPRRQLVHNVADS